MARCTSFVVLIALVPTVLCCGNMNIVLQEVNTKCPDGSTSVFQLSDDFGFTLSDECILQPAGCVEMTKEVKSAKVHYKVSTAVVPLVEDERDGCKLIDEASKDKDVDIVFSLFQMPKGCPVPKEKVCADGHTISLAEYKDKMMFTTGTIKGEAVTDHGADGKSCLNFVLNVSPKPLSFT